MNDRLDQITAACKEGDDLPDLSVIELLYCGNLAEDDLMWVVQCPLSELFKLIQAPRCWVDCLGDHPGWAQPDGSPAPRPILLDNFTMELQELVSAQIAPEIVIQGISRTGIITVRASKGALITGFQLMPRVIAQFLDESDARDRTDENLLRLAGEIADKATDDDWFAKFWAAISVDPTNPPSYKRAFDINVDMTNQQLYGHLQIYDPQVDDPSLRAETVGAFICASCCDPEGYVRMLEGLDQRVSYLENGQVTPGLPMTLQHPSSSLRTGAGITFLYASSVTSEGVICDVVDGPFAPSPTGGTGTPTNSTVKNYGP